MNERVVHCKKERYDVLIDRRSVWGNPFVIGVDGDRKEVINKFEEWIVTREDLMQRLHELEGKILGCWCRPLDCHGDILIKLINKKTRDTEKQKNSNSKSMS